MTCGRYISRTARACGGPQGGLLRSPGGGQSFLQVIRFVRRFPLMSIWMRRLSVTVVLLNMLWTASAMASEADLAIPDLHQGHFTIAGQTITAWNLLLYGAFVICGTLGISLY